MASGGSTPADRPGTPGDRAPEPIAQPLRRLVEQIARTVAEAEARRSGGNYAAQRDLAYLRIRDLLREGGVDLDQMIDTWYETDRDTA